MNGVKINKKEPSISMSRRTLLSSMGALALFGMDSFFSYTWASIELDQTLEELLVNKISEDSPSIILNLPNLVYDGSRVPFSIEVKSPMTETNYVRQVHVLAEHNPFPRIATFHFTPLSGKAFARTRIRLSKSQHVIAVAELNDGSILTARKWIEITLNGCKED
ncbi:MAG: thiosulfate oxidation carrier protein SoxY [Rhodobacterales bacterium]|jgi:sulfur-oxidizing protein SoxY|tara:strand:+ start:29 stop:520 length:492 start_codon:yes stop_codon:yes gene_type:complete